MVALAPMFSSSECRSGFSLVEAAIVLAVVGLVVGGIWVATKSVIENNRVNETASGVLSTCANLSKLYPRNMGRTEAQMGTWYDVDGYATAVKAGAYPASWTTDPDGWARSPLGPVYELFITAVDVGWLGDAAGNYIIIVGDMTTAECKKLVAATAGRVGNNPSLLSGIAVKRYADPGNPFSQSYDESDYPLPASLTPDAVDCSGDYNAVEFSCRP